jgi:hypothetical protein
MAGMERPHGWYEGNRAGKLSERLLELRASSDGAHRLPLS